MPQRDDLFHITRRVIVRLKQMPVLGDEKLQGLLLQEVPGDDDSSVRKREAIMSRVLASLQELSSDHAVVTIPELCSCEGEANCVTSCEVNAIEKTEAGHLHIDRERCVDCGLCAEACEAGAIVERSHCLFLAQILQERQEKPVYAILAPSFVGQFGESVSAAQLKESLRKLGFTDVFEVALAADILTVIEADEYLERSSKGEKFMITSCCCPAFIKLVEKHRPKLTHLISDAVSPMILLGRLLKKREPHCRVVFIGPCLAKRSESRRPELSDAIDSVLTFKETAELFSVAGLSPAEIRGASSLEEASHDGRIYAHTGGVTESIYHAIKEICPDIYLNPLKGNGLKQCNKILKDVEQGEADGNFMEGMACPGGCVGGPGTLIPVEVGARRVSSFAAAARALHARDNELAEEWFMDFGEDGMSSSQKNESMAFSSRL